MFPYEKLTRTRNLTRSKLQSLNFRIKVKTNNYQIPKDLLIAVFFTLNLLRQFETMIRKLHFQITCVLLLGLMQSKAIKNKIQRNFASFLHD